LNAHSGAHARRVAPDMPRQHTRALPPCRCRNSPNKPSLSSPGHTRAPCGGTRSPSITTGAHTHARRWPHVQTVVRQPAAWGDVYRRAHSTAAVLCGATPRHNHQHHDQMVAARLWRAARTHARTQTHTRSSSSGISCWATSAPASTWLCCRCPRCTATPPAADLAGSCLLSTRSASWPRT
jgi:hypothetical protein